MTTDIFAPKELSQKLREIGFDEPCIAIYSIHDNELKGIIQGEEKLIDNFILGKFTCSSYSGIPAPTWEQVFKWFREKGYFSQQLYIEGTTDFFFRVFKYGKLIYESHCIFKEHHYYDYLNYLTLELINHYKKEQDNG